MTATERSLPEPEPWLAAVVSSVASDAHTWNLVFLQLLLEELGCRVRNLGPCVPARELVAECHREPPDLVVLSSVNGHGYRDGLAAVRAVRSEPGLTTVPLVIGGKLGVAGRVDSAGREALIAAGADAVFEDGIDAITSFYQFVRSLPERATT
ncbi:cobalamin-dependent protein [Natronosporangium hydrolyticum]|uniref:Cobalamin-dependent protein n=1 Tax=Natronosporangium hydrolyticum TaxID=2811111 RepID=A0A895YL36_9ACTN|nr:cobalamin-dependent protein [Natronosporangium hydrolyticum]QSB16013.1 cobalamin-dependent protein [Natronosporangium hydrolyticum]